MNIGGLTIEMAADLARLRQDMAAAKASVGDAMQGMSKAVELAKAAFVGYLGVASIGAFKNMVMGAVEATGALHDMQKQTGNSAAALQQMRYIGATSETSLDAIASASLKLSKNLALTDEEGKGAALAIKALGIDFNTFVKLNPDQRMLAAAKALDQYEDGADKSAAAMMLFGKEGAKMLPFLADLAAESDAVTEAMSDQNAETVRLQAAMSDAFGDNLTAIQKQSQDWQRDISMGLLPAMWEMSETFLQMSGGAGGLKDEISRLSKDGAFADWARGGATAVSYVVDVLQGLLGVFQIVIRTFTAGTAGMVQLLSGLGSGMKSFIEGDYAKAWESAKDGMKGFATVASDYATDVSSIWNQKLIGETFRDTMTSLRGVQGEAKEAKKQLHLADVLSANTAAKNAEAAATKASTEETKKAIAAYEAAEKAGLDYVNALGLKNGQMQQEIDLGRKLTPVEQEQLKLTEQLRSGKILLSQADEEAARAAIEHGAALEREAAWMAESHKETLATVDATQKRIEQLQAETEKQREATAEMGLTTEQLGELRQAKLLDLAASADRKAALLDEIDWSGQLGDQQRELAKAYRDSATVAGDGTAAKAAKEAQDAWSKTIDSIGQGLSDSLFRAFESGKGFWDTLWDGIKNTVKSTVLKVVIQGVDGKGGIVGGIMSLLGVGVGGGAAGAGGGGGAGALMNLISAGQGAYALGSSVYTVGAQYLAGSMSGANAAGTLYANATGTGLDGLLATNGAYGTAGGSGASSAATLGWIAAAVLGAMKASSDYSEGFNVSGARDFTSSVFMGSSFGPETARAGILSSLGVSDRWASILSGSTAVAKLFGRAAPSVQASGVEGSFSGGDFGGQTYADMLAKGGLFRSDKRWTEYQTIPADLAELLDSGAKAVLTEAQKYAEVLSLPADKLLAVNSQARIQLGADGEANKKAITEALSAYSTALQNTFKADVQPFAKAGESVSATLARLAGLEVFSKSFTDFGGIFDAIAASSFQARDSLYQLAGGMEAFAAKATNFIDLYYNDAEKAAVKAMSLRKQLAEAGINADDLSTRAQYRALVDGTDVSTEAGRKQLVALLDAASQFADVAKYLEEAGGTLATLALGAPADSQVVGLLTEPAQASALAAQQSAELLATANDQLAAISDNGAASVRVQQAGFTQLVERMDALTDAIAEVVRPGQLAEMAR